MMPKLSIVVASYNTDRFLEPTLDSIFGQTFRDFECIVVDGASTDRTLEKLKKYPKVKLVSEKDKGSYDAFTKGIRMAQGEYIMQCCISDLYKDLDWFRKCVEVMDNDKEVSLVWGLAQYMREDGRPLAVAFPQFHRVPPPQKEDFFNYWLAGVFWFPEGNFCVRKSVFDKCFPPFTPENFTKLEPLLEFNFQFEAGGYLPYFLPVVANYGRIHSGQLGEQEALIGTSGAKFEYYRAETRMLRRALLSGSAEHRFRDGEGNILPYRFKRTAFFRSQIFSFRRIGEHIKTFIRNEARKLFHALESRKLMPSFLRRAAIARRRSK